MNIMVGPNNCGKSTIISSFRILDVGLKIAFAKSAIRIPSFNGGYTFGHQISENHIPVAVENVHTNYGDIDSRIEFRVSNGNKFFLYFPVEGGCFISWKTEGRSIRTPGLLRQAFPISIQVVPVLGPLEHEASDGVGPSKFLQPSVNKRENFSEPSKSALSGPILTPKWAF